MQNVEMTRNSLETYYETAATSGVPVVCVTSGDFHYNGSDDEEESILPVCNVMSHSLTAFV